MGGLISCIIIVIVVLGVLKKKPDTTKKNNNNVSRPAGNTNSAYVAEPQHNNNSVKTADPTYGQRYAIPTGNKLRGIDSNMADKPSSMFRDDRTDDWLARQLEDERRAFRETKDMFNLKIEHATQCDAEMIRRFHEDHCDAEGVDSGTA